MLRLRVLDDAVRLVVVEKVLEQFGELAAVGIWVLLGPRELVPQLQVTALLALKDSELLLELFELRQADGQGPELIQEDEGLPDLCIRFEELAELLLAVEAIEVIILECQPGLLELDALQLLQHGGTPLEGLERTQVVVIDGLR